MPEGTSSQSRDLRTPQPPKDGWLSHRLGYPLLYATEAQVTKGETQDYPERKDLKKITKSNPNREYVTSVLETLDLRDKPQIKECSSIGGLGNW